MNINLSGLTPIGEGAFGKVYVNPMDPTTVIKVNKTDEGYDSFKKEIEIMDKIKAKLILFKSDILNNLAIYTNVKEDLYDTSNRKIYITMPRYTTDLQQYLLNNNNKYTINLINDIKNTLDKIITVFGNVGIIHNDIKPANILLELDEQSNVTKIALADFGITSVYDKVEELYKLPTAKGTILYMSPMMIQAIDCTLNDFWSLACVLLNMVTIYILNNNPQTVDRNYFNIITPIHFFEAIMKINKIPHEINEDKTFTPEKIVESLINDTSQNGCNNFIECVKNNTNKFKNKQIKMELLQQRPDPDIIEILKFILITIRLFDSDLITGAITRFKNKEIPLIRGGKLTPLQQRSQLVFQRPQSGFQRLPSMGLRLKPGLKSQPQHPPPQKSVAEILGDYITTLNAINNITATDETSIKEELRKYIDINHLEKLYNEQHPKSINTNGGKKIIKRKAKQ